MHRTIFVERYVIDYSVFPLPVSRIVLLHIPEFRLANTSISTLWNGWKMDMSRGVGHFDKFAAYELKDFNLKM